MPAVLPFMTNSRRPLMTIDNLVFDRHQVSQSVEDHISLLAYRHVEMPAYNHIVSLLMIIDHVSLFMILSHCSIIMTR